MGFSKHVMKMMEIGRSSSTTGMFLFLAMESERQRLQHINETRAMEKKKRKRAKGEGKQEDADSDSVSSPWKENEDIGEMMKDVAVGVTELEGKQKDSDSDSDSDYVSSPCKEDEDRLAKEQLEMREKRSEVVRGVHELEREKMDLKMMTVDLTNMSDVQRKYFFIKQTEIIARTERKTAVTMD